MKRFTLLASVFIAAGFLTACDSDSDSKKTTLTGLEAVIADFTQESGIATCNNNGTSFGVDDLTVDGVVKPVCALLPRYGSDFTLTSDIVWVADGKVKVGFGDNDVSTEAEVTLLKSNSVTMTINAGTEIRSSAGGAIVITRGSKIEANGTAAAPIIMSSLEQVGDGSDDAEDYEGSGEWGGLVIQGFGMHNKCPNNSTDAVCNITGEGNVGSFGGNDNTDDSGTLNYVIIAEGGVEVAPDNEINGITFQGVGSGTEVDYIQVHQNQDDGVEFFGGAVNVGHLVLTENEDDSIDWDEGFQGNIQYAIVVHGATRDKGFETDNNGSSMDATPRSMPTLANITVVGNGSGDAIKHREGTGAFMYNSVITNFAVCLDIDDAATHTGIDTNMIYTNVIFDCTASAKDDDENASVDYAQTLIDSSVSSINEVSANLDANQVSGAAEATGLTTSFASATTADTSFLDATTYAGATSASVGAWWASWIVGDAL